jgi:threonylcarbamoyladenosine tRNA methylthiotransferase MtaB
LENISDDIPIRVAFETLGCKLNQAETEQFSRQLAEAGCQMVSPDENPDLYILNTCTVTHIADRKSRHLLRMARRKNPSAKIVALGCYAERASREISGIQGVDLVIGNEDKINLIQRLEEAGFLNPFHPVSTTLHNNRTRSFIKVQDGCNNFCSFCIVPLVRGREKSLIPEQVIHEINLRSSDGYQEIVLTGTEIGRYQSGKINFNGLVELVLNETEIPRIRLSSLQPQEISPALLDLWKNPRLCPHFHLSLQSGNDSVLARMNRRYNSDDYKKAVGQIRSQIQEVAITTDVIAGFPGETEKEFQDSLDFCRKIEFSRIHVFSYSARESTRAAGMPEQVEDRLKKTRSDFMLAQAEISSQDFRKRFAGRTRMVLFEQTSGGLSSGITGNYIKVYTKNRKDLTNRLLSTKLIEIYRDGMWGELA